MNAASGATIIEATSSAPITDMPCIKLVAPGATITIDDSASNVQVIGIYGSGANSAPLTMATSGTASFDTTTGAGTFVYDASAHQVKMPASATDAPTSYLLKFNRSATVGEKLVNKASEFPSTVRLTLFCSIVDPCDDTLKAAYVVLPSLQWSPETTISLSADDQEMDLSGSIQVDYCSTDKALYAIYFPDENAVKTAISA